MKTMRLLLSLSLLGACTLGKGDDSAACANSEDSSFCDDSADTGDFQTRTWRLDLSEATITDPGTFGATIASYFDNALLLELRAMDAEALSFRWGWSAGAAVDQDLCAPTVESTASVDAYPTFATDPELGVFVANARLGAPHFEDGVLGGTIDSTGLLDAHLSVLLRVAEFEEGGDPEEFCLIIGGFGDSCELCADGSPYCVRFVFFDMVGEELSPFPLERVEEGACP